MMKRGATLPLFKAFAASWLFCWLQGTARAFVPRTRGVALASRSVVRPPPPRTATGLRYVGKEASGTASAEVVPAAPAAEVDDEIRRLRRYQERGRPIASSFVPRVYDPHPLLANEHLQTILGVFLRDQEGCAYIERRSNSVVEVIPVIAATARSLPTMLGLVEGPDARCDFWDERERLDTPDGDFFHVDYKFVNGAGGVGGGSRPTVAIVHGLESNSNSTMCQNMARAFTDRGMDVACLNFRGCSGVPNDTVYQYHAGFTDDLLLFLELWSKRHGRKSPLYVTGFSLGANVVLKALGELGTEAVDRHNIRGAAVSGAPFSLNFHWRRLIDDEFSRNIYAGSLLKSMKKKADRIVETYCDGDRDTECLDYWGIMNATTIAEIEDAMIAPLYGFKDKFDYYDQSASLPLTDNIAVPAYVLNAADDPFFDPESFPFDKDCMGKAEGAPLRLVRTEKGGHLGHMFHVVDAAEKGEGEGEGDLDSGGRVASFAPLELARFLDHVQQNQVDS